MKTITILTLSFLFALPAFTGSEEHASTVSPEASEQTVIDIEMLNPFSSETFPFLEEERDGHDEQVFIKMYR